MESNWKTTKLLDHYDIRSGLSKPAKDFGSGYPFLTFKDVFYNYFTPDELGDLVQSSDKERENCSVKRGDVFLTRTSETMHELGMSCVALQDYENTTFNGFCKRLRPHQNSELVPEYVGYYLRSSKFRQSMLAFSTMSTRASLNNEMIGRLEISYPPEDEQIEIAKVLKNLDDKITLSRQINQTLEQMAQTLFKSWFVDFDPVVDNALDTGFFEQNFEFPDELLRRAETRKAARESSDFTPLPEDICQLFPAAFEECAEPSLGFSGWVPQGWIAAPLTTVANIVYGKNLPKTKILNEGYPVYGGNGVIGSYSHYLYKKPQVLISCRGAASGKVHWTKPFCFVTNNSLVIEEKNISSLYIYYSLLQQDLTNLTSGSAQPQMTIANLNPVNVLLPKNEIISRFVRYAQDLQTSCEARKIECEMLSTLRDTLLPKLISGELRLSASEIEAADDVLA